MALSSKFFEKFIKTNDDKAFVDSSTELWDQNVVNGQYVISYEVNQGLDDKIKNMLPEVNLLQAYFEPLSVNFESRH